MYWFTFSISSYIFLSISILFHFQFPSFICTILFVIVISYFYFHFNILFSFTPLLISIYFSLPRVHSSSYIPLYHHFIYISSSISLINTFLHNFPLFPSLLHSFYNWNVGGAEEITIWQGLHHWHPCTYRIICEQWLSVFIFSALRDFYPLNSFVHCQNGSLIIYLNTVQWRFFQLQIIS